MTIRKLTLNKRADFPEKLLWEPKLNEEQEKEMVEIRKELRRRVKEARESEIVTYFPIK